MAMPNEAIPQAALLLFQRGQQMLGNLPENIEEVLECFEEAARHCNQAGATYAYGSMLSNIGFVYALNNDHQNAREHYNRALAVLEADWPESSETANVLANLGALALLTPGMHMAALRHFKRALAIDKAINPDSAACGRDLDGIAGAYERDGDIAQAIEYYDRAMPIQEGALPRPAFEELRLRVERLRRQIGDEGPEE